jgi:hypothetical protein
VTVITAIPQVIAEHGAGAALAGGGAGGAAGAAGVEAVGGGMDDMDDIDDMDDMPPPHAVKTDIVMVHTTA